MQSLLPKGVSCNPSSQSGLLEKLHIGLLQTRIAHLKLLNIINYLCFYIKRLKMTMKIIGIALVVLGVGMAFWGYQLSGSVGSQITQAVTGSYTDRVMTYYIIGGVSFVVGLFLSTKR